MKLSDAQKIILIVLFVVVLLISAYLIIHNLPTHNSPKGHPGGQGYANPNWTGAPGGQWGGQWGGQGGGQGGGQWGGQGGGQGGGQQNNNNQGGTGGGGTGGGGTGGQAGNGAMGDSSSEEPQPVEGGDATTDWSKYDWNTLRDEDTGCISENWEHYSVPMSGTCKTDQIKVKWIEDFMSGERCYGLTDKACNWCGLLSKKGGVWKREDHLFQCLEPPGTFAGFTLEACTTNASCEIVEE